jgi:hypothetical protein
MKKNLVFLLLAVLTLSFFSCGKYEDGPFFSILSKKQRLDGIWSLVLVLNNDVDVTTVYPADQGYTFDKNGSFKKVSNGVTTSGTWEFNDDKSEIYITIDNSPNADAYHILRLTNKHLWWKRTITLGNQTDIIEEHYEVK